MIPAEQSSSPSQQRRSTSAVVLACLVSIAACGFGLSSGNSDSAVQVNPVALETAELLRAAPSEEVCLELLQRDLSSKQLNATIHRFARIRRTTPLNVLCSLTENLKDASSVQVRNLTLLFVEQTTSRRVQIELLSQSRFRNSRSSRRVVTGVTAALQEDAGLLLQSANSDEEQIEILNSLVFVPAEPVRRELYDQVRTILQTQTLSPAVQMAAIRALSESGLGNETTPAERAEDLIKLIISTDTDSVDAAAFAALASIDASLWPAEQVGVVASAYIAWRARNPGSGGIGSLDEALMSVLTSQKRTRFEQRLRELNPDSERDESHGVD